MRTLYVEFMAFASALAQDLQLVLHGSRAALVRSTSRGRHFAGAPLAGTIHTHLHIPRRRPPQTASGAQEHQATDSFAARRARHGTRFAKIAVEGGTIVWRDEGLERLPSHSTVSERAREDSNL